MNETTQNQLIADLARDVVTEIAPQELPMFRLQSEAYFKDPDSALEGHAGGEDMLGFGAGAAAAFLTSAVLAVTTAIVKFVALEAWWLTSDSHNRIRQGFLGRREPIAPALYARAGLSNNIDQSQDALR